MIGERIRLARRACGLTMRELGDLASVSHAAIGKMEKGHSIPSPPTLSAIATATQRSLGFFSRPAHSLSPPLYRKRASLGKKRMETIEALATIHTEAYLDACEAIGAHLPVRIPECEREDIEAAALQARSALGLTSDEPCGHVLAALEQAGAVVIRLADAPDSFDGFSAFWGPRPVVILDPGVEGVGDRSRWTAAHELGHLVLHRNGCLDLKSADREADQFAGAFLLPRAAILKDLQRVDLTPTGLAPLKAKWRVSLAALVMRASGLGLLSDGGKERAFRELSARGWRRREPVDIPLESPVVFRKVLRKLREKIGLGGLKALCPGLSERGIADQLGFRMQVE